MLNRRNQIAITFAITLTSIASIAGAQGKFPDGTLKVIVPFAPGGGVDNAARLIAKQMQANLRRRHADVS